ncbi:hypothetical protein M409DRAFT_19794 [Zasmidium cellare ATCC 36951]|uniref:Carboxypeptidase n=1 Tax=Zasmidium cellare ATCC 36951 TaxID=1080233 RepID=A0A6A6CSX0_ZASCE|nr:uncharacterized protein M409DRAFT_19794 [Zasmidium cellare ATCC 36951]KAF2170191.1 hypothetical protein M409DRAFT_19794 [Zasmidium cellare ATCC 36951]
MVFTSLLLAASAGLVVAVFPPKPEGVTTLPSRFHEGVTVSYKPTTGVCETTPGVRSFAGYIHLPSHALNETHEDNRFPINTFYWFFESRKDPKNAPLAIWLNGGPGGSSLLGALSENGPCFVHNDSRTTYLNPWSWNNEVNLLFIDQPNQVGYSYDVLTNVTVDIGPHGEQDEYIKPADFSEGIPEQNNTFLVGTSSSQKESHTANSTHHAAVALWHFAQTFFEEFPGYKPHDEQISLFTESYGGHYGPGFVDYLLHKNELIRNGTSSEPGAHYLHLKSLGIINGCIDAPDMIESEITFPFNNTYGLQLISDENYEHSIKEFHRKGGVLDAINECRELVQKTDPHDHGEQAKTNKVCAEAADRAMKISDELFVEENRGARFDITHEALDPYPPPYMFGWLNQYETQKALGVPVNHTWGSPVVARAFDRTGDIVRGGQLEQMAYVLSKGVQVTLFHGDRDFACNWVGGEKYSLNIPWPHQDQFKQAGYTPVVLSSPYLESAGLTRQYGNLSFTRVYQAGHMVPSYQPEAAYRIFMRSITGKDIATGEIDLNEYASTHDEQYSTTGPSSTWHMKNDVLPQPPHECYVLDVPSRCTAEEAEWIGDGSAIVKNWILIGRKNDSNVVEQEVTGSSDGAQIPLLAKDW